ncbi:MAG: hypothetical protein IMZ61_03575 [Planctomycetes bacterium]|nr:hypothetical protein [Planctomycetota bacterium]
MAIVIVGFANSVNAFIVIVGFANSVNAFSAEDYFYSQHDSRWSSNHLGTSTTDTIENSGCALTSVAMLLKWESGSSSDPDPGQLNTWLTANNGYTNGDWIVWSVAAAYDGSIGLTWIGSTSGVDEWSQLDSELAAGRKPIVVVDGILSTPALDSHYVVVYDRVGAPGVPSSYKILDPWDTTFNANKTLATYTDPSSGYTTWGLRKFGGNFPSGTTSLPPPSLAAPGTSTTPGSSVSVLTPMFQWQEVTGADGYGLYVSKFDGVNYNLVFNSETDVGVPLTGTSYQLPGGKLMNGGYYRWNMSTHNSAGYGTPNANRYYFYVSLPTAPAITSPVPGSTLSSSSVTFQWSSGSRVSDYVLITYGTKDIYGVDQGLNLSATVNGLPQNGSTLYVRLWWQISGNWQYTDYTYTAYTLQLGSLQVTIYPAGTVSAGAQWNVDGGAWQSSGAMVSGLSVGNHTVAFNTVTGWTTPGNQTVTINNNSTTTAMGTYVVQTGLLQVTIYPAGTVSAGAQWNVDGGAWQSSGAMVSGLSVGNHTVAFNTVTGWTTPGNQTVTIYNNSTTITSGTYVQQTGSLQVNITHASAISAGAKWQVDGGVWQNSGVTVSGVSVGSHTVNYKPITGWTALLSEQVNINNGQTTAISRNYEQISLSPMTADLNHDGLPNFYDFSVFATFWQNTSCSPSNWCNGGDFNKDGIVDIYDLQIFAEFWLWSVADVDMDDNVDFVDYAAFANHWREQNCAEPNWCEGTDFDHSGSVDMLDLATFAIHWLEGFDPPSHIERRIHLR